MHLGPLRIQSEIIKEMSIPEGFRMAGWVYILSNDFMPGIYKIGMTTTDPSIRAKELSSATGVPGPFKVEATFYCSDPARSEKLIHQSIDDFRVNDSREFFKDDLEDLIGSCEEHCDASSGISVEEMADSFDVISFESIRELNLDDLFEDIGINVFGNNLAVAERLIRMASSNLDKSLFQNNRSLVLMQGNAYAIEGKDFQFFKALEEEEAAYNQQKEAAGIYGPLKPVDI